MVSFISSWARQMILAVLIAIILEMILLDKSKTTKYIKTVIGIYVMYVIISPGLNLLNGKNVDFSNIDYEEYITSTNTYKKMEESCEKTEDINMKEIYELRIKQDIENKLREKGYIVSNIKLETEMNIESENYGIIKKIEIKISKRNKEESEGNSNEIEIDRIDISISEETDKAEKKDDYIELKEFISQEYGIELESIIIK